MEDVEFAWLADRPQFAPRLAALHHAEWAWIDPDWTLAEALANLQVHTAGTAVPTTRVAFAGGELAGSVSLLANDHSRIRKWSPWLASLLVLPEFRGRGIGAALVRAALARAAEEGVGELFLFTPEHKDFYARLGWRPLARTALKGTAVDLMCIAPRARPESAWSAA